MRTIIGIFAMLLLLISAETMLGSRLQQNEEQQAEPTPPQAQATSKAAEESVTGCVVHSDHGYSLKTATSGMTDFRIRKVKSVIGNCNPPWK